MATSNNIITHGLSGKVGDILVFSQRNGKTVVGKLPDKSHVQQSEKQKQTVQKFQEAVIYAKSALADAATKATYDKEAKEGQTAYNVAVADFFNAPQIDSIDLSQYTGQANESIVIKATDDFKVKQVIVAIYNSDGSLVEKGDAKLDVSGLHWVYLTTVVNEQLSGDKIVVQATDMPGNLTESQKAL